MYGSTDNTIALGYAVAYPLGVIGIILSIIFIRYVFRVNFDKENEQLNNEDASHTNEAKPVSLIVKNPAVFGKSVGELSNLLEHRDFVISRIWHDSDKPKRLKLSLVKRSIWSVNNGFVWKASLSTAVS